MVAEEGGAGRWRGVKRSIRSHMCGSVCVGSFPESVLVKPADNNPEEASALGGAIQVGRKRGEEGGTIALI